MVPGMMGSKSIFSKKPNLYMPESLSHPDLCDQAGTRAWKTSSPSSPAPKLVGKAKCSMKRKMWGADVPAGWESQEQSSKMLLIVRLNFSRFQPSKPPSDCFSGAKLLLLQGASTFTELHLCRDPFWGDQGVREVSSTHRVC